MAILVDPILGRAGVSRQAERRPHFDTHRPSAGWLVAVRSGEVLMASGELRLLPVSEFPDLPLAFLGGDDQGDYFANLAPLDVAGDWAVLRNVGHELTEREVGLATTGVALFNWHYSHPVCSRCGHPTQVATGGWSRRCPTDATDHFPRTDPAVIVLVTDPDERLLLARQQVWPAHQFSVLAGFVEAGESLESACRREVLEESGITVGEVEYLGSQPWPFPASLMLAFSARALDTELRPDGEEIVEAEWFSRADLAEAAESGRLRLPPPTSIARQMIDHWYGQETPASWTR